MIYIDEPHAYAHKRKRYSHMMCEDVKALHTFAQSIGIKRCWFHRDHYDVREEDFSKAVDAGATVVDSRFLVGIRKRMLTAK